jgi:hypothetical protein
MSFGLRRNVRLRGIAVSTAICLAGCGEHLDGPNEPSAGVSAPAATPSPAVSPVPSPTPTPSPTPEPAPPSPLPNHRPTVTVTGDGKCYPRPCQITFKADGQDPDGDALEYKWSGCASGRQRTAVCQVDGLGDFQATVRVTDGRGGETTGTGTARGVNNPPRVDFGFTPPLRPNHIDVGGGYVTDEDQCGNRDMRADVSGACDRAVMLCSDSGILDIEVHVTEGPGQCRVTVTFRDRWGAVDVVSKAYTVGP